MQRAEPELDMEIREDLYRTVPEVQNHLVGILRHRCCDRSDRPVAAFAVNLEAQHDRSAEGCAVAHFSHWLRVGDSFELFC